MIEQLKPRELEVLTNREIAERLSISAETVRRYARQILPRLLKHFGDGLWDVPYLPLLPKIVQFGLFGLPAFLQVATHAT